MLTEFEAALLGGIIGGFIGVIGTLVSSYYGPRRLEEWREKREEEQTHGPRKRYLKQILEGKKFDWYSLSTLARATGTTEEECRILLIKIGARGSLKEKKDDEMWALEALQPIAKELEKRKNVEN